MKAAKTAVQEVEFVQCTLIFMEQTFTVALLTAQKVKKITYQKDNAKQYAFFRSMIGDEPNLHFPFTIVSMQPRYTTSVTIV